MIIIRLECRVTLDEEKDRYPRGGNHPFEEQAFIALGSGWWLHHCYRRKKKEKKERITKE